MPGPSEKSCMFSSEHRQRNNFKCGLAGKIIKSENCILRGIQSLASQYFNFAAFQCQRITGIHNLNETRPRIRQQLWNRIQDCQARYPMSASKLLATLSQLKLFTTRSLARSPVFSRNNLSDNNTSMASASKWASLGGVKRPAPSATTSGIPPTIVETTGTPHAMASAIDMPKVSSATLGNTA